MADISTGPSTVFFDLIDDLHIDTITFHNADGHELHRAPVVGREPVVYHYDGPDRGTVQTRAWVDDECVYEFGALTMFRGTPYRASFDA